MRGIAKVSDGDYGIIEGNLYTLSPVYINFDDLVKVDDKPGVFFRDDFIVLPEPTPRPIMVRLFTKLGITNFVGTR